MDESTGTLSDPSIRQVFPKQWKDKLSINWLNHSIIAICYTTTEDVYLYLPLPVIYHSMLSSHCLWFVQRWCIKGHFLDLGNSVGHIGLSHTLCLLCILPELKELFEKRSLSILRDDLDLSVFRIAHLTYEVLSSFHTCTPFFFISLFTCFIKETKGQDLHLGMSQNANFL